MEEINSTSQKNVGEINFSRENSKKKLISSGTIFWKTLIFFRLRRANLPCKFIIFEAQNPKIFRLRRAFPLEKHVSNHFVYKKIRLRRAFAL